MIHIVECRSEFAYAERPVALTWEGRRLDVQAVVSSWRSPEAIHFCVRTDDHQIYKLAYCEVDDEWHIQPY